MEETSEAEIGNLELDVLVGGDRLVHFEVEQNVLRLQISVYDIISVYDVDGTGYLLQKYGNRVFAQRSFDLTGFE